MGLFTSREYTMTREGDKYTFLHQDGYLTSKIEGTIKEIAFAIYKEFLGVQADGYGVIKNWGYGPFYLEENKEKGQWEILLLFDDLDFIEPEPEPAFWEEMNRQINRFFNLTVFT